MSDRDFGKSSEVFLHHLRPLVTGLILLPLREKANNVLIPWFIIWYRKGVLTSSNPF